MQNKHQAPIQQSLFDISELAQFTGTSSYYQISRRHLLTEGTKYLAERAGCFWMMDAVASHLCEIGTEDWFVMVRVQVVDSVAVMVYEDGNGHEHARQAVPKQTSQKASVCFTLAGMVSTGSSCCPVSTRFERYNL